MENKDFDTSYSGIVNKVQGNMEAAKTEIINMSAIHLSYKKTAAELSEQLKGNEERVRQFETAVRHVIKHMKMKLPLAVKIDEGIIVISETAITLETNVI